MPSTPHRRSILRSEALVLSVVLLVLGVGVLIVGRSYFTPTRANAPAATSAQAASTAPSPAPYPPPLPTPTPDNPRRRTLADIGPNASYQVFKSGARVPSTTISVAASEVVVIATVKQVLPARWNTPQGQRPDNPFTSQNGIFRPVLIEVEAYLKGERPQSQLHVYAWGGVVGQDSAKSQDNMDEVREGERVVLFLQPHNSAGHEAALHGQPFYDIMERYEITAENQATNYYRTLALEQLLAEITTALQTNPLPSAIPSAIPPLTP